MNARARVRHLDGSAIHMNRWGFDTRLGGVLLHRFGSSDPRQELHDHSWWFVSVILWGGYTESRASIRTPDDISTRVRRTGSVRTTRLDECHRIDQITNKASWSLVVHGPLCRRWGRYVDGRWTYWRDYEDSRAPVFVTEFP